MGTNWKTIFAGNDHSLAIKTDGTLWAWGSNANEELGDNTLIEKRYPIQVESSTNWAEISAGFNFTVGKSKSSTISFYSYLYFWGYNSDGELADGTTVNKSKPTLIYSCSPFLGVTNFEFNENFSLYLNPAHTQINIQNSSNLSFDKIYVIDVFSEKILEKNSNFNQINIQNLVFGIYFLQIAVERNILQTKFIK